jgi:branched-chain amino acid aminotransferase
MLDINSFEHGRSELLMKASQQTQKARPKASELGFGKYFTDHIFKSSYTPQSGWQGSEVSHYSDLTLDPGADVIH